MPYYSYFSMHGYKRFCECIFKYKQNERIYPVGRLASLAFQEARFFARGKLETSRGEVCQGSGTNNDNQCYTPFQTSRLIISRGRRHAGAEVQIMRAYSWARTDFLQLRSVIPSLLLRLKYLGKIKIIMAYSYEYKCFTQFLNKAHYKDKFCMLSKMKKEPHSQPNKLKCGSWKTLKYTPNQLYRDFTRQKKLLRN